METDRIQVFLNELDRLDNGQRTALKREAGTMLSQAGGGAMRAFYQCLPYDVPGWQEERYFAAACLHCLWDKDAHRQSMEQILFRLGRDAEMSESMSHRLASLLDLTWDVDGYLLTKLTRMAKWIRSKDCAIDCAALLQDLLCWNGDRQTVQLKWAKALYMKPETTDEKEGE